MGFREHQVPAALEDVVAVTGHGGELLRGVGLETDAVGKAVAARKPAVVAQALIQRISNLFVPSSPCGAATKFCPGALRFGSGYSPRNALPDRMQEGQLAVRKRLSGKKVDRRWHEAIGEIPRALGEREHVGRPRDGAVFAQPFVIDEEKRGVPSDRPRPAKNRTGCAAASAQGRPDG